MAAASLRPRYRAGASVLLLLLLLLAAVATCPCSATKTQQQQQHHGQRGSKSASGGVQSIVTEALYNRFLPHRDDASCPARLFYNYTAFLEAAEAFPAFGTTGSLATRKREVAAFFGQTSHETGGGSDEAPGGRYAWGYCYVEEINQNNSYCDPDPAFKDWPCSPGQRYFGRGPIQLSWNYNYGAAGKALGFDGLAHPGAVAADPVLAFKSALWFWMTPGGGAKPSAHDVAVGRYRPSAADRRAGRAPGYGLITNIINGGLECGVARNPGGRPNATQRRRIGFFRRYARLLRVGTGPNLSCSLQHSF